MKLGYSSAITLALTTAVISGTANFLNKLAVTAVTNPTIFTFIKNGLVAILLIGIILAFKKWPELKQLTRRDWLKLILIGVVGGSLPFILFFKGLSLTSALNAALIHKTLFVWVAFLAIPLLKEKISWIQGAALVLLIAGNFVLGGWQNFTFGHGEIMIFIATLLWAMETIIAKKTLQHVSSLVTASSRMVFGSIILLVVVSWQYQLPALTNLTPAQWGWLILPSLLLLGYVLSWYSALKQASAILVTSLLVPATIVTNLLSAVFITHSLAAKEILSATLLVAGITLFIIAIKKIKPDNYQPAISNSTIATPKIGLMDGILRCSRYAFGPNRLHYCGPDANSEIASYIKEGISDPGLEHLLKQFKTMYPYLNHIAEANKIANPFDERVVEAYWIGNELLETIEKKKFYRHLIEDQQIKKRVGAKEFELVSNKLKQGAVPHHSFHVLDIWLRTGNLEREHTLESMDECRVSWGRVTAIDGPNINVLTRPLLYAQKKLFLGDPTNKKITRRLESTYDIEQLAVGDIVSIHWSVPCEVITQQQAGQLEKYTLQHITFANQTI